METLKKNYEFRRLYSKGKSAVTRSLVVYCRETNTGRCQPGGIHRIQQDRKRGDPEPDPPETAGDPPCP